MFNIKLSDDHAKTIVKALEEMPLKISAPIYQSILTQIETQQKENHNKKMEKELEEHMKTKHTTLSTEKGRRHESQAD